MCIAKLKNYIFSHFDTLIAAIKFPGTTQHSVRQDSAVISAASSSATNGLECPPEQPQAVIPQGKSIRKVANIDISFVRDTAIQSPYLQCDVILMDRANGPFCCHRLNEP